MALHDKVVIADILRARLFPYVCGAIVTMQMVGANLAKEEDACCRSPFHPPSTTTTTSPLSLLERNFSHFPPSHGWRKRCGLNLHRGMLIPSLREDDDAVSKLMTRPHAM